MTDYLEHHIKYPTAGNYKKPQVGKKPKHTTTREPLIKTPSHVGFNPENPIHSMWLSSLTVLRDLPKVLHFSKQ